MASRTSTPSSGRTSVGPLAKLAARSSQLRQLALEKKSGILGSVTKTLAGAAIKNPVTTGLGVMGAVSGVQGAKGKYREYKAGFSPAGQQAMLGQPPVPPGA